MTVPEENPAFSAPDIDRHLQGCDADREPDLRAPTQQPGQVPSAEHGQGMAEYGLILALVAVVLVGALTLLGTNIGTTLTNVAGSL